MIMKIVNEDLLQAKEKRIWIDGKQGQLEAIFNGAEDHLNKPKPSIAILGHPHSLHGGTMNNKVVTTIARACRDCQIPSLRFNFRGVGESQGEFDRGIGESEDVLEIIDFFQKKFPEYQLLLAGFSFGAYVTYRAASQAKVDLLISIAPAVTHGDFSEFSHVPLPWHVLVAEEDEVVSPQAIFDWHDTVTPSPQLHRFKNSSHFFHGQLVSLKKTLKDIFEPFS